MNHVYRVVFNHALKCVQVVSEFARGRSSAAASATARRAPQLAALSTAIALGCITPGAFAAQAGWNEWLGTIDFDWGKAGNWDLGEPTAADPITRAAYIDSGRIAVVTAAAERTNHIHVGDTGLGTLRILGGGQLRSETIFVGTGDVPGSAGTADGRVVIDGPGSRWDATYTIGVGHLGRGLLDVTNGGTLAVGSSSYIGSGTTGQGVVNVIGPTSRFTTNDMLYVAYAGQGQLTGQSGAQITSSGAFVGVEVGSIGNTTLTGADSTWQNRYGMQIGYLGQGTVTVLDGAQVLQQGDLQVATASASSSGALNVSGTGSRFVHTGVAATIGVQGQAQVRIDTAGEISLGATTLGSSAGSLGNVVVDGAGSRWYSTSLNAGIAGQGDFTVTNGATAEIGGNIALARDAGSSGHLTVGQNAYLVVSGSAPATITSGNGQGVLELAGGWLDAHTGLRVDSNVLLSADSSIDAANGVLLRGTVSGSGQLQKWGQAALNFTNVDNSQWTGGLSVQDGTVWVAGSNALGTGVSEFAGGTTLGLFDGVLLNNAVYLAGEVGIEVAGSENATLANASGASSAVLVKRDTGTLTLGGGTVGETRVEGGTLRVTGNALNGGNVEIGSNATFEIDTTRVLSYAGQFSGDGFLRLGRFSMTLSGDNSAFTGTTVINAGQLNVTGELGGDVQVTRGGWLTGTGTLGNVFVSGGSTVSPGNFGTAISRLDVNGVLNFDSSSTLQVDVAADGASDFVAVGGTALLGQANTVAVATEGDWKPSTRYHLLSAAGGITGTFAGASSNLAFLTPTLEYDPNNVYLVMARNDVSMPDVQLAFPDVVVNTNQKEVAGAVEALGEGNAVYDAVVRLEVPQVVPAFDSLSGEVHAAHRGTLLQNRFLHDGIDRHLDGRAINAEVAPGVNVWLAGSGGQLRTDGTAQNTATRVSQDGLMAGAGWQVGEALELGVAAGSQRLETRLQGRSALAKTDSTEYGVYAQYRWNSLSLRGGVTRADYRTDTTRAAQVGTTFAEDLVAREDATGTTAFVRAGWTFGGPRLQLTPEIELAQVRLESDGSQERGGDSALVIGSADSDYRTGVAALKADWDISGGQRDRAVLTARVGWQYADGDRLPVADARFVEGTRDFSIAGTPLARSTALAQVGVAISPSANSRVSLQVQGRRGGDQRELGAQLDWSVGF